MDQVAADAPTAGPRLVSVVVPTSGRAAMVADCLESLVLQDYPAEAFEVVVVHNGPPDGTEASVRAVAERPGGPRISYLSLGRRDANSARNAGIDAAEGDPVCLLDDDVLVPPGWLSALVDGARRHPGADCVGGPIRPRLEGRAPRTCDRHELAGIALEAERAEGEVRELWGANMAIRRDALRATGGFRPGMARHQEWEWEQRLLAGGGTMVHVPGAWLWHRRTRADLRPSRMAGEFFMRGWTKASTGFEVDLGWVARRGLRHAAHGVRGRCTRGMTEAARDAGLVCAELVRRARRGG
jgi:GT2 family glycosyltransferase